MVVGLVVIGGVKDLVDFVSGDLTGRLSLMVIGGLVTLLGLVVTISGWRGANRTMELQLAKKAAMMRRRKTKTT